MKKTKSTSKKKSPKRQIPKWVPIVAFVAIVGGVGAYLIASSQAATKKTCRQQTFKLNSSGPCVSDIQALSNYTLFGTNSKNYQKVDGKYGTKTRDYVKLVQAKNKFKTVDGVVGSYTWYYGLCFPKYTAGPIWDAPAWVELYKYHANCGA